MWEAFAWGAGAAASLLLGALLAKTFEPRHRITGAVMGFGAGTLLSAVAYDLIPLSSFERGLGKGLGLSFVLGALVYFGGDRVADRIGGRGRQQLTANAASGGGAEAGSGTGILLGTLLDGIPESFVLGITLAIGGGVSTAFLAAIFISNVPEGIAGTLNLEAAGHSRRQVFGLWTALMLISGVSAALGFVVASSAGVTGLYAEAFAGGAVLTMLADSMMPQAFKSGGTWVGVLTVFGYLLAAVLSVSE